MSASARLMAIFRARDYKRKVARNARRRSRVSSKLLTFSNQIVWLPSSERVLQISLARSSIDGQIFLYQFVRRVAVLIRRSNCESEFLGIFRALGRV